MSVSQDLPGLAGRLSAAQFNWRPRAHGWSIGQCIEHLNITTERYLPVIRQAVADGRLRGLVAPGPFAPSLVERWFIGMLEPPVRLRVKAPRAFVAPAELEVGETLARWSFLHHQFAEVVTSAAGLDRGRIKVRSQFGPISFGLGATFAILLAHERRHVWQARQVRNDAAFPTQ